MNAKNIILPDLCVRAGELGLLNMEPWYAITESQCSELIVALGARYPNLNVRPFARRQDCDDIACVVEGQQVVIIHDFASQGWEKRKQFVDFTAWFRAAVEDFIEFNL